MSSFVLILDVMFLSSVFDLFHLSSLYCFQFSLVTLHQKRENHEKIKSLFFSSFPNFILIYVNFCAEKKTLNSITRKQSFFLSLTLFFLALWYFIFYLHCGFGELSPFITKPLIPGIFQIKENQ